MKIIERFAEYCGLADSEKAWLEEEVVEAARTREDAPGSNEDFPSPSELDAFDEVVRGLLAKRRGERPALRAKVARGCLRGVEQEELYLTDETIVAAVDALHEAGAFEPDDAHHMATFLGQYKSPTPSDVNHLAAVCEDLVALGSLTEVHRLDLMLSMLACAELPLEVRSKVLLAAVADKALPIEIGVEILVRVLEGSNLYRPYWHEGADDYMDARPSWMLPGDPAERDNLVQALGEICHRLTPEMRERAQGELDDLDDVLDFLETEEGAMVFENLSLQLAERLPAFLEESDRQARHGHSLIDLSELYPPELRSLEPDVQQAADEVAAPRKSAEVLLTGLGYVLEELRQATGEPAAFAAAVAAGDEEAEAVLLDICSHVLDCTLQDSLNQIYIPLMQMADMSDEDLERMREMALASRDSLMRGSTEGSIPADLVELLNPFEARTAARLNRVADEDLSFVAARLLVESGYSREDVARLAGEVWDAQSLEVAGEELGWVKELVAEHSDAFSAELVAAARNGAPPSDDHGRSGSYN